MILDASQPVILPLIEVHKTTFWPLPAMNIDESSISGVISVVEAIFKELDTDIYSEETLQNIILIAGDLKSGMNLQAAQGS
jgi:hypothetical protein